MGRRPFADYRLQTGARDRAAHLIERAGFGATPEEIARLAAMTPQQAVDRAGRLRADRQSRPEAVRRVGHLGSRHGSVPAEPGRSGAHRARARRRRSARRCCRQDRQRRLQPVVDKFFYSLTANGIETQRLGLWWANRMLASQAAARGEADAVLARPLRHRREQGPRLPDDAAAERDVPRAAPRATCAICWSGS